jgi:hypothetical protein
MNTILARDHTRLEVLLQRLLLHVDSIDFGDLWQDARRRLAGQIENEERMLATCDDLANVARLRGDHARLRELVEEIDSGYRLGVLRKERLWSLLDALRTHGVFEEEVLKDAPAR